MTMAVVVLWHEYLSLGKIKGLAFGEFEVRESIKNYLVLLLVFSWAVKSYLQFKQTFAKPLPASSISVWALLTLLSEPSPPQTLFWSTYHVVWVSRALVTLIFLRSVTVPPFFASPAHSPVSDPCMVGAP